MKQLNCTPFDTVPAWFALCMRGSSPDLMAGVAYRSTGIVSDKPMTARMAEVKIGCDAGISRSGAGKGGRFGCNATNWNSGKGHWKQASLPPFFIYSYILFILAIFKYSFGQDRGNVNTHMMIDDEKWFFLRQSPNLKSQMERILISRRGLLPSEESPRVGFPEI